MEDPRDELRTQDPKEDPITKDLKREALSMMALKRILSHYKIITH